MAAGRVAILAAVLAGALGAGCMTTEGGDGSIDEGLDQEVHTRIEALATARAEAYEENVRVLGGLLRATAFPRLVEALGAHPSARVRAGCALALADTQNPAAVEPLAEAAAGDADAGVRYTAAYALCRYRDPRGLPVLFQALRSEDPQTRFIAIYRLKEVTGEDRGFIASDPPEAREAAVDRWETWYREAGPGNAGARLMPVE